MKNREEKQISFLMSEGIGIGAGALARAARVTNSISIQHLNHAWTDTALEVSKDCNGVEAADEV